jgi:hypothetical protein
MRALLLVLLAALAGCATQGKPYAEIIEQAGAPPAGQGRVVVLRPDQRFDNYSLSKAYVRIDDEPLGKLAYGGFLLADVEPGAVVVSTSARSKLYGVCRLPLEVAAGETLYLDLAPRTESVVADVVGTLASFVVPGVDSLGEGIAAGTAGVVAASAIESAGKACGGPYRLTRIPETTALSALARLTESR